jgi:hypothetical protein
MTNVARDERPCLRMPQDIVWLRISAALNQMRIPKLRDDFLYNCAFPERSQMNLKITKKIPNTTEQIIYLEYYPYLKTKD